MREKPEKKKELCAEYRRKLRRRHGIPPCRHRMPYDALGKGKEYYEAK